MVCDPGNLCYCCSWSCCLQVLDTLSIISLLLGLQSGILVFLRCGSLCASVYCGFIFHSSPFLCGSLECPRGNNHTLVYSKDQISTWWFLWFLVQDSHLSLHSAQWWSSVNYFLCLLCLISCSLPRLYSNTFVPCASIPCFCDLNFLVLKVQHVPFEDTPLCVSILALSLILFSHIPSPSAAKCSHLESLKQTFCSSVLNSEVLFPSFFALKLECCSTFPYFKAWLLFINSWFLTQRF